MDKQNSTSVHLRYHQLDTISSGHIKIKLSSSITTRARGTLGAPAPKGVLGSALFYFMAPFPSTSTRRNLCSKMCTPEKRSKLFKLALKRLLKNILTLAIK